MNEDRYSPKFEDTEELARTDTEMFTCQYFEKN